MLESALNHVDSFTYISKALNELWILRGIGVTQAKLPVRVVFSERIDQSLVADEEAEIVAAGYLVNLCFLRKWHPCWKALFNTVLNKRPSIGLTTLAAADA